MKIRNVSSRCLLIDADWAMELRAVGADTQFNRLGVSQWPGADAALVFMLNLQVRRDRAIENLVNDPGECLE
jgi:hypothetical protein